MPRNMTLAKGGGDCPHDSGADFLRERPQCRRILGPAAARLLGAAARPVLPETDDGRDARSIRRLDQAHPIARRTPERRATCESEAKMTLVLKRQPTGDWKIELESWNSSPKPG